MQNDLKSSHDESRDALTYLRNTAQNFLDKETIGGLLLMIATAIALLVANSSWASTYHYWLEREMILGFQEGLGLQMSVSYWINDGLMVIFFLVVGLELKRELLVGELSDPKKAAMPIMAAIGGMVVPAVIFAAINAHTPTAGGWGIPMATDIAYSLGILAMLGTRIPIQLKAFLISLAIADDIGAIMVIALFYSDHIAWAQMGLAAILFTGLLIMNYAGVKKMALYVITGIVFWMCFLHSGIHPTIAGVLFAMTIPLKPKVSGDELRERVRRRIGRLEEIGLDELLPVRDKEQRHEVEQLKKVAKHSYPLLLRLENGLAGFNAFFVIPVFALANAGVALNVNFVEVLSSSLGLGIFLGLLVGKVCGVSLFSYLGHRLGFAELPEGLVWRQIVGVGFMAGIGFTMSLFITNLAFESADLLKTSKITILLASLGAVVLGVAMLLTTKRE